MKPGSGFGKVAESTPRDTQDAENGLGMETRKAIAATPKETITNRATNIHVLRPVVKAHYSEEALLKTIEGFEYLFGCSRVRGVGLARIEGSNSRAARTLQALSWKLAKIPRKPLKTRPRRGHDKPSDNSLRRRRGSCGLGSGLQC